MGKKSNDRKGAEAFDRYFGEIYGSRWPQLREALGAPTQPGDYLQGLVRPYYLDVASVEAALALDVQKGDTVLDMCAAPGGKTLVLALALQGTGTLTSNDRSPDRRGRLRKVVQEHLPEVWSQNVRVTGYDAAKWGLHEQECYDRILLDAPCSSERHLLHQPSFLKDWSPHRTRSLAQQGLALLCAALAALRPGGMLVYSTCSISPEENENQFLKLEKKRPGQFVVHKTKLVLPDTDQGSGPLFYSVIEKKLLEKEV